MVLELCTSENLESKLKKHGPFNPAEVRFYMYQIIEGLLQLQHNHILHRDLKLANLFLTRKGDIKIGDFGLACCMKKKKRRKSICGTPNYIAPEILNAEGYGYPADVWAVGVLLYSLLIGHPPFETSTISLTYKRIENCIYMFPMDVEIPISAKVLIQSILTLEVKSRPSMSEILHNEFFTDYKIPISIYEAQREGDVKLKKKNDFKELGIDKTQDDEMSTKNGDSGQNSNEKNKKRDAYIPKKIFSKKMSNQPKRRDRKNNDRSNPYGKRNNYNDKDKSDNYMQQSNASINRSDKKNRVYSFGMKYIQKKYPQERDKKKEKKNKKSARNFVRSFKSNIFKPGIKHADERKSQKEVKKSRIVNKSPLKKEESSWLKDNKSEKKTSTKSSLLFKYGMNRFKNKNNQDNKDKGYSKTPTRHVYNPPKKPPKDIKKEEEKPSKLIRYQSYSKPKNKQPKENEEQPKGSQKLLFFKRLLNNPKQDSRKIEVPQNNATHKKTYSKSLLTCQQENKPENNDLSKREQNAQKRKEKFNTSTNSIRSRSSKSRNSRLNRIIYTPRIDENKKSKVSSVNPSSRRTNSCRPSSRKKINFNSISGKENEVSDFDPEDFIKRWIDHSEKYGLVYIMNRGSMGILFNDSTKIVFKLNTVKFVYIAKDKKRKREQVKIYSLNFPPKNILNKVNIMQDIRKSIIEHEKTKKNENKENEHEVNIERVKELVYVKNWVKASQVTVFKLVDSTYQAVFQDKSEILMNSKHQSLIFIDKEKKRSKFKINSPDIQNNRSLFVRIEYFKKVLRKWIERDSKGVQSFNKNLNTIDI